MAAEYTVSSNATTETLVIRRQKRPVNRGTNSILSSSPISA